MASTENVARSCTHTLSQCRSEKDLELSSRLRRELDKEDMIFRLLLIFGPEKCIRKQQRAMEPERVMKPVKGVFMFPTKRPMTYRLLRAEGGGYININVHLWHFVPERRIRHKLTRFGEGFLRIKAPLFAVEITMIALHKPLDESMMIDARPKPERPEHLSVETEWWENANPVTGIGEEAPEIFFPAPRHSHSLSSQETQPVGLRSPFW